MTLNSPCSLLDPAVVYLLSLLVHVSIVTHAEALLRKPAERLCRRRPMQWNRLPKGTFPLSSSGRLAVGRGFLEAEEKARRTESMPFQADNGIGGSPCGWTRKACRTVHALSITLPEPAVDNTVDSTLLVCKQPLGLG